MSVPKDCQNWVHVRGIYGSLTIPPRRGAEAPQRVDADTPDLSHVVIAIAVPTMNTITPLAGGCCYPYGGCNTPASGIMAFNAGVPKNDHH